MVAKDFAVSAMFALAILACAYALEICTGYTYTYNCTDEAMCLEYYEE